MQQGLDVDVRDAPDPNTMMVQLGSGKVKI
jgi:hypothetical protein